MDDDFLDRCAEAEPEDAALLMALYNEGVRQANGHWDLDDGYIGGDEYWFDQENTGLEVSCNYQHRGNGINQHG